jgi:hypothetical protein
MSFNPFQKTTRTGDKYRKFYTKSEQKKFENKKKAQKTWAIRNKEINY